MATRPEKKGTSTPNAVSSNEKQKVLDALRSSLPAHVRKEIDSKHIQSIVDKKMKVIETTVDKLPEDKRVPTLLKACRTRMEEIEKNKASVKSLSHRTAVAEDLARKASESADRERNMREKVEMLAEELTKQNKLLMTKHEQASKENQARFDELKASCDTSLQDIVAKQEERAKVIDEHKLMCQRLEEIIGHQKKQVTLYDKELKAKEQEMKALMEKAMTQAELIQKQKARIEELLTYVKTANEKEILLRKQLAEYSSNFDSVHELVSKSSESIQQKQKDNQKLALRCQQLEALRVADAEKLRQAQSISKAVSAERQEDIATIEKLQRQKQKLESLCKILEQDRAKLKAALTEAQTQKTS